MLTYLAGRRYRASPSYAPERKRHTEKNTRIRNRMEWDCSSCSLSMTDRCPRRGNLQWGCFWMDLLFSDHLQVVKWHDMIHMIWNDWNEVSIEIQWHCKGLGQFCSTEVWFLFFSTPPAAWTMPSKGVCNYKYSLVSHFCCLLTQFMSTCQWVLKWVTTLSLAVGEVRQNLCWGTFR